MALRGFLIVLIMGLPMIHFVQSVQNPIAREPQMIEFASQIASPSEGVYYLVSGTDVCAGKVRLRNDCGGFKLSVMDEQDYAFCAINKGTTVDMSREGSALRKTSLEVKQEGLMIQRKETVTYTDKGDSLSLVNEDTVMFNAENQLLWEHSRHGQGFSCLYSK